MKAGIHKKSNGIEIVEKNSPARNFAPEHVGLVEKSLADPRWDFRQPKSIAQETGLELDHVTAILVFSGVARPPIGQEHLGIFTRANRKVTFREVVSLVQLYVAKRP